MNLERLKQLEELRDSDPNDPFATYALAIELKASEPKKALEYLKELIEKHPGYLPTYYQAAELMQDLGIQEIVEGIYLKGMKLAEAQNDTKTLSELKSAYEEFIFEND